MRRFLLFIIGFLMMMGIAAVCTVSTLAVRGPFLPGDLFFPSQFFAEQLHAGWYGQPENQATRRFELAERRLENAYLRTGTNHELIALEYLQGAIDQVIHSLSELPGDDGESFRKRLLSLIQLSSVAIKQYSVAAAEYPDTAASFLAKLAVLEEIVSDPNASTEDLLTEFLVNANSSSQAASQLDSANELPEGTIDPLAVPFPENSPASKHDFYALVGVHAQIECTDCHSDGVYDQTPTTCEACHGGVEPEYHYLYDCAACHTPYTWGEVDFDHTLAAAENCVSCHRVDKPAGHYSDQCSACHNAFSWLPASFNHQAAGATNCKSCHLEEKPTDHYDGQCSACHVTASWRDVTFNHGGQNDCISCHVKDKPANHFGGQCSACHNTNDWDDASFNHAGYTDCTSCHTKDKPANHYGGQCSACHNTNDWDDASFNHAGYTDCTSCHTKDKPANHYGGQCSACHNTVDWDDANFNHAGQTDCASCHAGDRPSGHYNGQCSQCHNTNNWDAEFNHKGLSDCKSCHASDRPKDHDGGQCSQCHNTNDWDDADEEEDDDGGDEGGGEDEEDDIEIKGQNFNPRLMNANISPFSDCTVCHGRSENVNLANTSFSPSPWYLELWVVLQAAFKV